MELWNDPTVLPPPINTNLHPYNFDTQDLLYSCNNLIKVLSKQSPLHKESALLSRFLYKFDKKFRSDIGYRFFKKVNTALRKYLTLNLLKDIKDFVTVIPDQNEDKYLPTRQMLEYVMVRIMSFAKIMLRICICSKQASIYYMHRIKKGESHWMSLMPYALMCRIWTMSKVLLQHSCSWYSGLYPCLKQLQLKGLEFLPVGYTLPSNLEDWLDINSLDDHGKFEWCNKKGVQVNLNFGEDEEIAFDAILDYVKDINNEGSENIETAVSTNLPINNIAIMPYTDGDQGVSISREHFQSFFKNQIETKDVHSADNVTSKVTLDKFISKEEEYRNEDSKFSLTRHLSFMQWQTLKTSLVNLSGLLSGNRKVERKFKKVWKEKCLDYQ